MARYSKPGRNFCSPKEINKLYAYKESDHVSLTT
jgi:hypothetical protein